MAGLPHRFLDEGVDVLELATRVQDLAENVALRLKTLPGPPRYHKVVAVLIWLFSRKPSLAALYLAARARTFQPQDGWLTSDIQVALKLFEWLRQPELRARVLAAFEHLGDRCRILSDQFLIRSLVAESVFRNNRRGLSVAAGTCISMYISMWSHRPCPPKVQGHLVRLTWRRNDRRKFTQLLRQEWFLTMAALPPRRSLGDAEIWARVLAQKPGP